MNPFLKISAVILYELFIFVLSYVIWHHQDFFDMPRNTAAIKLIQAPALLPPTKPQIIWKEIKEENAIPQSFKLEVPFTPQAPFGNWANPWQEFCEEAVILMTAKYYINSGQQVIPSPIAGGLMRQIMFWEEKTFGYHENTGTENIARTVKELFGLETKVIEDTTVEKIKEEILRYRPVIIPAAGRLLKNPHFQKGGPLYHTVLVIGYDDSDRTFIVHEPGTRFGREYKYSQQKLFEAIRDWEHDKGLVERKVMVVVE